jgi:hypothetical protein
VTQPITYETVLERMAAAVPQLAKVYEAEVASWASESPPPIVFIELKFVPHLVRQLESGNELEIKRCFSFLEQLASSPDTALHELLGVAVVEPLIEDEKMLDLAIAAAGPKFRKLAIRMRDWPPW